MDNVEIKKYLQNRLMEENVFWSYDKDSVVNISDWNLIKFVMIYLDLNEIDLLFQIYSKSLIKKYGLKSL